MNNETLELRSKLVRIIEDNFVLNKTHTTDATFVRLKEFKSIIDNINGFIVICNYTTGMYEYVSDGIRTHLGHDVSGMNNEELTHFVFSLIYKPHADLMLTAMLPVIFKYFKENSTVHTGTDYRYTCCVKVKNKYDNYLWYLIDTTIIEIEEHGFPLKTLITCTNINQFKKDDYLYYNLLKKNASGVYHVVLEGVEGNNSDEYKLTSREIEIINLIGKGYTNKQIAHKLFISLNTVQTHRKNILKKTNCNGTAELTNFAFSRGLL